MNAILFCLRALLLLVCCPLLLVAWVRWHAREARHQRQLGRHYEGPLAD